MKPSVILVLSLSFGLAAVTGLHAQQEQPLQPGDPSGFDSIRMGTRIEITLKNRAVFSGEVVELKPDRVKLCLTYEKEGAKGYMTFHKREIKKVVLLALIPADEKARIIAEREAAAKKAAAAAGAAGTVGTGPTETGESTEEKERVAKEQADAAKAEKRRKNQELIARFPASEWNEERKNEIEAKPPSSRTPEEEEFLENYERLIAAREEEARASRRDLLRKFPPPEWGPAKYDELKRSRFPAVEDVFMTDLEKEFVDNFSAWLQAHEEEQAEKAGSGEVTPKAGSEASTPPEEDTTPLWEEMTPPEEETTPPEETTPDDESPDTAE